jgi:hypothetical protein
MAVALLLSAQEATENPRVCRFLYYYNAVKNTDAPVNFWERLVFSFALSNARADATTAQSDVTIAFLQQVGGRQASAQELRPSRSNRAACPSRL